MKRREALKLLGVAPFTPVALDPQYKRNIEKPKKTVFFYRTEKYSVDDLNAKFVDAIGYMDEVILNRSRNANWTKLVDKR